MSKFFIARNMDSDDLYRAALWDAGFEERNLPEQADFIVHDAVHPGLEPYLATRPNFIYPHTPQSSFLWDGILSTKIKVNCNFVYGEGGRKVLASYKYPYRVETIGFTRCEVQTFRPTTGNNLLIIPSHPLQHGEYTYPDYMEYALGALRYVYRHRAAFGKITLCWDEDRFDPEFYGAIQRAGWELIRTNPYKDPEPLKHMMERMEKADLIFSCGTAGTVACAMGKPTVFMTERGLARTAPRDADHSDWYSHILMFPLTVESMSIDELLAVRTVQNSKVEFWKQEMIGGNFNARKFVNVIKEYVK